MMKKIIKTDKAPSAIGPYSQAIVAGNFLFGSGQIPLKPDGTLVSGTIGEQTRQVLDNIKGVLEAAEATLNNIVKTTVFLKDMAMFEEFNLVYSEYFAFDPPARATIEAARLPKDVLVEIEFLAVLHK